LKVAALLLVLFAAGSYSLQRDSGKKEELRVVRIDDENSRIFVEETEESVRALRSLQGAKAYAAALKVWVSKNKPEWGIKWHASLFSDKRYAGYKTDPHVEKYIGDGSWSRNYLAEYSEEEKLFVFYPALPEKLASLSLKATKAAYPKR
jgi:hypothetical protein